MMNNEVFEAFNTGVLRLPQSVKPFSDIPWSKHPVFEGVELKHILTSKDARSTCRESWSVPVCQVLPRALLIAIRQTDLCLYIFGRRDAEHFSKPPVKVALVAESCDQSHFCYTPAF